MRTPLEKKSYLIVDDFGDMRSMLRSMLAMFGVTHMDTAATGKEAVQQMERNRYDVILCDYNLGSGKDGQQVLEEARHRGLISISSVFVMITAENTREMVLGAIEYEPDSYLSKPFTKDLLRNRLEKLMAKKEDLEPVDRALEGKDYAEAVRELDRRIAGRPKNLAELTRLKADLCLRARALDQAQTIYERVLAIRELPWARLGAGKVLYARRQYREAREVFQGLLNANEDMTAAYDWLARTYEALNDFRGAQEVLVSAVALSPKAILRQRALGEVAMHNQDYAVAERAFTSAVALGRHSVFKHPVLYASLAQAQVANPERKDKSVALQAIKQLEREFPRDSEAQLYAAMAEAVVQQSLGNGAAAAECMARAEQLYERQGVHGKPELTLGMARAAAQLGRRQQAEALLHEAVRDNHEDDTFLHRVELAYREAGLSADPVAIIKSMRQEIRDLNNRGVQLASAGQVEAAASLFEAAAERMSGNRVINLNAAKVLLLQVERKGPDAESLSKVRRYLERLRKIDPDDPGLARVLDKLQRLVGRA
jgi:CheY-like chemotaxis protein/Flp pilus assembly protein TadD